MTAKTATAPKPKKLPDDEVQAIADMALSAWESGIEAHPLDSVGGTWIMLPERSAASGLWLIRETGDHEDPVVHKAFVRADELGTVNIRHTLASMVMALVSPAAA